MHKPRGGECVTLLSRLWPQSAVTWVQDSSCRAAVGRAARVGPSPNSLMKLGARSGCSTLDSPGKGTSLDHNHLGTASVASTERILPFPTHNQATREGRTLTTTHQSRTLFLPDLARGCSLSRRARPASTRISVSTAVSQRGHTTAGAVVTTWKISSCTPSHSAVGTRPKWWQTCLQARAGHRPRRIIGSQRRSSAHRISHRNAAHPGERHQDSSRAVEHRWRPPSPQVAAPREAGQLRSDARQACEAERSSVNVSAGLAEESVFMANPCSCKTLAQIVVWAFPRQLPAEAGHDLPALTSKGSIMMMHHSQTLGILKNNDLL